MGKTIPKKKKEDPKAEAPTTKAVKAPEKKVVAKAEATKKKEDPKAEADKKEVAKVSSEKTETQEVIQKVPDACDAVADGFKAKGKVGFYDGASNDCKECGEEFPEALKACKHNTELEAKLAAIKKIVKKGSGTRGECTPLGGRISSGAGKNELLMLSKEGASKEEMLKNRGAVSSHIASRKKEGFNITLKEGRYYAKV